MWATLTVCMVKMGHKKNKEQNLKISIKKVKMELMGHTCRKGGGAQRYVSG